MTRTTIESQSAPAAASNRRQPPRWLIPAHAIGFTIGAIACWAAHRHVAAFLLTLAAIAFTSDWINSTYRARVKAEGKAPRWLTRLEITRAYLGSQEPDVSGTAR